MASCASYQRNTFLLILPKTGIKNIFNYEHIFPLHPIGGLLWQEKIFQKMPEDIHDSSEHYH